MSRLIDADEIRIKPDFIFYGVCGTPVIRCEDLARIINDMPTIEPQQWIPCSERLPSDHERYLLTEEVHYTTGRIIRRVLMAFYDDENDEWYEEMGEDVEVVSYPLAWMPLPEPYMEEDEAIIHCEERKKHGL